jgi:UDP-glucose 4-epimerase
MAFHKFIRACLLDEHVHVYGSGNQTRDFTYVDDVVAANIAAGASRAVGVAFNIGGGSQVSINSVIDMLGSLLGRRLQVEHMPVEYGDVRDTSADTFSARKVLGFLPKVDLASGLEAEVHWVEQLFKARAGGVHEPGRIAVTV